MALALSFCALVTFIISGSLDEVGFCTHWSLVAGDLLMYLGLAHTVAGFFAPWVYRLTSLPPIFRVTPQRFPFFMRPCQLPAGRMVLATYVGPAVSLVRSPFDRRINIILAIAYLLLVPTLLGHFSGVRIEEMALTIHPI